MREAIDWLCCCSQTVLAGAALAAIDPLSERIFGKAADWVKSRTAGVEVFREHYRKAWSSGLQTVAVALRGPAWYSSRLHRDFARDFDENVFLPFACVRTLDAEEFRGRVMALCERLRQERSLQRLFDQEGLSEREIEEALSRDIPLPALSRETLARISDWAATDPADPAFAFLFGEGHLARAVELHLRESFFEDERFRLALSYADRETGNRRFSELEAQIARLREDVVRATQEQDFGRVVELSTYMKEFAENVRRSRDLWERLRQDTERREAELRKLRDQLGADLLDALDDLHSLLSEEHGLILREIRESRASNERRIDGARDAILGELETVKSGLVEIKGDGAHEAILGELEAVKRNLAEIKEGGAREAILGELEVVKRDLAEIKASSCAKTPPPPLSTPHAPERVRRIPAFETKPRAASTREARASGGDFSVPVCRTERERFSDIQGQALPDAPWPNTVIHRADGMEMVAVPPGPFVMGNDQGSKDEAPAHELEIPHLFYMSRYPVANAAYRKYLEAAGEARAAKKFADLPPDLPAVQVTWQDADRYCRWAGGSLPFEAEWEKAARGPSGTLYPWGSGSPEGRANFGARGPAPVNAFPLGESPYGCHDMAGNVWEWCWDWYEADYYRQGRNRDLSGPPSGKTFKAIRGASWKDSVFDLRASRRFFERWSSSQANIGFRYCVRF